MSTTPVLSNREKFPFFLRTVPSDANTVQGIVHLLSRADGNDSKICISTKLKIDSLNWGAADYRQGIHDSLLAPLECKTSFLVFLSQPTLAAFLDAVAEYGDACRASSPSPSPRDRLAPDGSRRLAELAWIGTDSWSGWRFRPADHSLLNRSVIIMPQTGRIPGFADYVTACGLRRIPSTPGCGNFAELPTLHFVSDAVYAYAHAIKAIQAALAPRNVTPRQPPPAPRVHRDQFKFYNGIDGPPEYSIQYYSFQQARWTTGGTYV
uniref:ANF_receptor domain-containing protein n=1 Tax=Macrostomum lignano TaxID=282301 RepID=A0A1I8FF51_9PLAT